MEPTNPSAPWTPPARPPRPKGTKWWIWLAVGIGAFLLAIGAVVIVLVVLLVQALTGPIDASNEFLGRLRDREYTAATASMCTETPYEISQTLADELERDGPIRRFNLEGDTINGSGARVSGTITTGERTHKIVLELRKEDDEWRVCDAELDVRLDIND